MTLNIINFPENDKKQELPDFVQWLRDQADLLEKGKYVNNDDIEYLYMITVTNEGDMAVYTATPTRRDTLCGSLNMAAMFVGMGAGFDGDG